MNGPYLYKSSFLADQIKEGKVDAKRVIAERILDWKRLRGRGNPETIDGLHEKLVARNVLDELEIVYNILNGGGLGFTPGEDYKLSILKKEGLWP